MPKTRAETWQREKTAAAEIAHDFKYIIVYQCPRCPWFRARTNKEIWERVIIKHPVYGFISNYRAYEKDIKTHNCEEYLDAKQRCFARWGTD